MQITVFGASGKVGRRVVEAALARDHTVVAFVHSRDPFSGTPKLIVKKGDIHDPKAVAAAVQGSDAVVSTLGSWGSKQRDIVSAAMEAIIPAMRKQSISRIVSLTGTGALAPGEPDTLAHRLVMRLAAPFPAGKVFSDGERHMRLLADSRLDWTTLRSPIMRSIGSKRYSIDTKAGSAFETIHRHAVATAMLDELTANEYLGQAPIIHPE